MKSSKKALAFALAAAMAITGIPVTNAGAATTTAKLGATKATIYAGNSKYISVSTPSSWKRVKLSVSSSRTSVASVKKNNAKKKIRVDAVKAGTAKVTVKVTAKKSGKTVKKTLSANITVKDYKVRLVDAAGTTVSNTTIDTTVGTAVKLTAKTAPANDKVTFTSDNESVATVDASGNVTPVKAGTVTITAASAKAADKVTINVSEAAEEGITAKLVNPYSSKADLANVILLGEKAVINVKVVKDGKPVVGETVLFDSSAASKNENRDENNYAAENTSAVTNANGIATFVFGYRMSNNAPKSSEVSRKISFNYNASLASTGEKVSGNIIFAALSVGEVNVVNNDDSLPKGIEALAKSVNKSNGDCAEWTHGTDTLLGGNTGIWSEYVTSQQVSKESETGHQVKFDGYIPQLYLPGTEATASEAKEFTQDINYTSGEYHTYASDDPAYEHVVELEKDPREVTWAQLNFTNLQLSPHTKLVIRTYKNKDAIGGNGYVDSKTIDGGYYGKEENAFTYNLPLKEYNSSKMYIQTKLYSYGEVDDDKNAGFTIKNITGVYKTEAADDGKTVPLDNVKVTWESVTAPLSDAVELKQPSSLSTDLAAYARVTYRVPAFPYTGNAILTCYNKNNEIVAYYVCPTANKREYDATHGWHYANVNMLDYGAECYKVSKEEAFNQVGKITDFTNDTVTVNSEKTGVTTLVGKVTDLEGNAVKGFDAANDKVYTSVQWNPLPSVGAQASTRDGFFALMGQTVDVVAQLTDVNGNAVSTSGVGVDFTYEGGNITSIGQTCGDATAVDLSTTTDPNGQAKLTLQAANVATVAKLKATTDAASSSSGFKVVLKIADQVTNEADVYWVDANLNFVAEHQDTPEDTPTYITGNTTAAIPYAKVSDLKQLAGTNWEYGMRVVSNEITAGTFAGKDVKIKGLKINMTKDGVGTITTDTGINGMVRATSTKAGKSQIIGKLNASSISNDITFVVDNKEIKCAGKGATNLDKQLTINVDWQPNGYTTNIKIPTGTKVILSDSASTNAYVSITDIYGNAQNGSDITITVDKGTITTTVPTTSASTATKLVIAKENIPNTNNGIIPVVVKPENTNATTSTIITATAENKTVSKIINWVKDSTAIPFDFTADSVKKQSLKGNTVTLTLTDDVVADSVKAGAFTVDFAGQEGQAAQGQTGTYEVSNAVVSGKTITLTIKNGPTTVAKDTVVTVNVNMNYEENGVKYPVTSVSGRRLTQAAQASVTVNDK